MGNLIWADMENYMGKGWKDETDAIYNTTEVHTGPENKRECPCDTCPLFEPVSYTHLTLPTICSV